MSHRDEFRNCYEREINAQTGAKGGKVVPNVVLGSTGKVTHAVIDSTTLNVPNTEACILTVMRRIQFPIPNGGGVVQFTFPFTFRPIGNAT